MLAFIILMITMVPMGYLLTSTVQASTTHVSGGGFAAGRFLDGDPVQHNSAVRPARPTTDGNRCHRARSAAHHRPGRRQKPQRHTGWHHFRFLGQLRLHPSTAPDRLTLRTATDPRVIELQVTVSWGGPLHNLQSVTDSTNIDYPKPGLQTEGFISLQLEQRRRD